MDQLTEEGDISVMMDPVEIPSSELNSVNSVQDRNHETIHDQEKRDCSVRDQSRCITPERKARSKNDSPLFDKPSCGTAQEPAFLAATHIEDYSDVSSCSEADFSWVFNVFENNPNHSSECPNPRSMRDENELKKDVCQAEIHKAQSSAKAKVTQDYACGAASESGGERQSGSVNDVMDGGNQREKSLNFDHKCSNLSTTEGEMGCPLKTEEQIKGGFLIQNVDYGVSVKSKSCEDTTTSHKSLVCALDLNDSKQSDEKIAIDAGNTGVQNDCHFKGINHTCVTKNQGVQNTVYDEMTDDWSKRSQEVEHSSFEFLHSCFGLSSLYNAKLDHNAANLSRSMTHSSQKSVFNHIQPSDSLSTTPISKPRGQIKEAADNFLQKAGQQNDTFKDKIIPGLASTESTNDTRIKNSGSLLSSKSLLRKLQPVVLVKTNNRNASNGNMYVCSVCQNNTHTLDELIEHHHCKHSNHTFQYCLTCGAYFSNGALTAHVCEQNGQKHMQLSHTMSPTQQPTERLNAKYLCKYCKKPFVKMSYYQDHEQRHRNVTSHRCPCCGLYFPNAKKLAAHKRKVKCFPLILEPNKQRNKSLETNPNNPAKPIFSSGIDGCQIGLHDCFVKLVDINKKKPFPQKINCPVCGKTFKLRAQLKVHLRSHSGSKPFKCNKCKKVFKYSWNLEKHKKEPCSGHITKQQHEPSTSSRFPGRFACPTCPQILRYSYNRTRHMRQRCLKEYMQMGKGKVGNRYKCPLCNETFSLAANRNRHIKNTCFQQYKLQGKIGKTKLVKENVKEEKEEKQVLPSENLPCYNCNVCQTSFACKSGYHRHMNKHPLFNCSTEEVGEHDNPTDAKGTESRNERLQSQESSRQTSSDMDTDQTVLCRFCDKCFSSSDSLTNHLQIHVGKKPFCCLDCGKNFGRRGHLIAHKNVHKRRIQCSVCKKIVPTIGDLLKHRQSHIKKGMLQCPDCPMQFKFPVFLLRHVATHAKKAMPKSSLPAEPAPTKSANEIVKEFKESFVCGICKKTFVDSKTMSDHCLTHLPKPSVSQCPVCKHSFTSRIALIRHIRLHTGEKPFPCKTCGMRFRRKEALKLHERKCKGLQEQPLYRSTQTQTHEKHDVKAESKSDKVPKKFACSYCPHIFKMSGHLKMHEKAHLANSLVPCSQCGKYYKKNKIYGHRKHCKTKESSGQPNNSDEPQNAHKSESKDGFTSRTCRKKEKSKDMVTYIKDHLKEQCPHCSKRFQFRSYLLRHLSTHFRKKLFSCEHCGQKYGSQSSCQEHEALCDGVMRQHEAKRLNESEEAKIISNGASSLKDCTVIMGENGKQFKCNFCTKTFTKSRNLRRHILTHTEVKPYRCKTCENCFSRYDHLKFHQIRCRGKKQQLQQIPIDHIGSQSKTQPQSYMFECSSCSIKFSTHTDLTRHFSKLHSSFKPFSCKRCGAGFTSKDSLRRHCIRVNCQMSSTECLEPVQVPTKLSTSVQSCRETSKLMQRIEGHYSSKWKFQCEYCPRRFKTQSQLKLHTRLHTGEKPFACSSCDERFIRKDYLKRHFVKCTGKREGPKVLCDRCGGLFTQEALEVHQNNCIVSLKPTDCPTNGSNISSPLKVNAFSCANCNDRFLLYSQLQQHILTKHRSDGFQQSSVLEYEQLSSNLLIKEEPVDDNYAENMICHNQKYVNNGHENTEGNIKKPYECEQCNLRFITNSGLGMHMRTHRKIYPLSCHRCNKGFWSKNVQQKHMKKCKGLQVTKKDPNTKDTSSELECTPTDNILVFNKGSNTTGTGVLQTQFSCKDQDKGNMDKGDAVVHKYQCSECDQSFTDGLMLISHLEAHGREDHERRLGKSHRCHICGKTFDQASVLQRHTKTQHQETVKNTCPECFRSFRYPSDLDIHRSCHDLNRPFVCNTCELRFWTSKSLITHQRLSHSDSEPLKTIEPTLKTDRVSPKVFTCNPCNKVYTVKRSYMKHCRVKHKGSSECLDHLRSTTTEHQLSNNESDGSDDKDVSDNDSDSAPYFPCHVCGKTFLTSENLEDHQRCHLGEKPYECEECGKCFVQLVNLQQHQRSHKSEFQCQMCGKGFVSLFALRKHKHTHVRKRPHRCTKCHLTFTQSSQLAEHMITHRDENFPCDLCHENFSCKSSRAEHRKIHTEAEELPPLIPPAKQNSSPMSINSSRTVQQYRYRCEICHTRFPDPEQLSEHGCNPAKERPYSCKDCNQHFLHGAHLKKHQLTHQLSGTRSFQCNNCHMSFSHRSHFLRHLQTHGGEESSKSQIDEPEKVVNTDDSSHDKIYKCPICPESFSQVLELANHLSVHANMCNVCNKTFSTKQQLEKHEQCHLSAATQYECTECGKSFIGSDAFRQHYCVHQKRFSCSSSTTDKKRCLENSSELFANEDEEEVDVGEDFYNCPTCNKRFPSNISLEEHQKLHEFGRPFKCLVCGKGFAKKKYLAQHQQIHNERPYQCDLCSNSFKSEQSLLSHRKSHNALRKYHCSVCDKSYRTPYDLSRHEQKHPELQTFSGVREYHRCDMCYKSFSLLSQLRQHQETHVGQVVYECTECDKAFAFLHLLKEHQQTHGTSTDSFQSQSPADILFQSPVIE